MKKTIYSAPQCEAEQLALGLSLLEDSTDANRGDYGDGGEFDW